MSDVLSLRNPEHGVVMSRSGADKIPEGVETAGYWGMRSQHYGWPGIAIAQNGDILVSASERVRHTDPFGRGVVCRSSDSGRTWSDPEIVFDSNTDDRDAALCVLPDGTVVLSWFSSSAWAEGGTPERVEMMSMWQPFRDVLRDDTLAALSRGWLRRSHDHGCTWEDRIYPTVVGVHAGPTSLSNGDMIYCGPYEGERLVATRSGDGGKTWSIVGEIPCDVISGLEGIEEITEFDENHCLEIGPDHIICVFRVAHEPLGIAISVTRDGGGTWTRPRRLDDKSRPMGHPPKLLKLKSGEILCVFANRLPGEQSIRGIVSYDGGETWDTDNILLIRRFEHHADLGYPGVVEISPGRLLCIYYYVPFPVKPGEPTPALENVNPAEAGILSTHFCLEGLSI